MDNKEIKKGQRWRKGQGSAENEMQIRGFTSEKQCTENKYINILVLKNDSKLKNPEKCNAI